ncbi:UPF0158 family protein [Methylotenera mobilis]|jgi:hypothetical protein|uniref:Uncharacterized protein n=1 Tax=Methylotenera mobilis TaxID=359408 RepID=A0A351R9M7_9PROT|nr:UPF0158 family protein [Methylotenera mobilis]PPC96865.1 MAG: hypothetical protein CTY32_03685 [Methylotenera sp.]HBA08748.1 hypothetical protein [Methylotenera mobilis]
MLSLDFSEIRNAFEFVSSGSRDENNAYVCKKTGVIYWTSTTLDLEEEVPKDLETSLDYVEVPHKNELKLGQSLALTFIDQTLPDEYNFVASLFRKRGAYRRFKDMLQYQGLLEKWYAFEEQASDDALLAWCEENEIKLIDKEQ